MHGVHDSHIRFIVGENSLPSRIVGPRTIDESPGVLTMNSVFHAIGKTAQNLLVIHPF